ncbi:MAG TPA: response regulator transcription factor [Bryobacteraceae bacterium]|nr:response regulator transcription factor [Bryobacteraceae bacterium]
MNCAENILIIEDDPEMAHVLRQGLEEQNYSVLLADNGGKGLEMARTGMFGAIILDVMLPLLDGYSVARQLRQSGIGTPILMLTALDSTADLVAGFDAGAEDFLSKPFSFLELLARLRSLLRRGKPQSVCLRVADLTMDTTAHRVLRGSQEIPLTRTEYLLLEVLMRGVGQVVSRGEIVKAVWGSRTVIEKNSIDVSIKSLRGKIDENFPEKLIHTVRGFGYKLAALPEIWTDPVSRWPS